MIIALKIGMILVFILMMYINYLANAKPINGRNQETIANDYPSLFTPSGYAFSIWAIIYFLLMIFLFKTLFTSNSTLEETYMISLMFLFVLASLLNILWLIVWHYDLIVLSSVFMLLLLIVNILMVYEVPVSETLLKTTFSLYAGWIMVAFIANISIMLVKLNFTIFKDHEELWYNIVLSIGLGLILLVLYFDKNVIVGLVFNWAFLAIYLKHKKKSGYYLKNNISIMYTGIVLGITFLVTVLTFIQNGFNLFL